jgi:hypothetical protein
MNTQVTEVCSLSSELPTDTQQAPAWLVSALQVPREKAGSTQVGVRSIIFAGVILKIRPYC